MALTAYQECEKRGLHIGQDIAVTGFDDWERIRHVPVPITTIRQDSERSGYMAVYSALELARSLWIVWCEYEHTRRQELCYG